MSELNSKDIEIIHSFNESNITREDNKTDFVKKSMGAFGYELLSEDLTNRWSQIARDVFGGE